MTSYSLFACALLLAVAFEEYARGQQSPRSGDERAPEVIAADHQAIRQRTAARFPAAAFLSCVREPAGELAIWMAPLIAEQLGEAEAARHFTRFGRLDVDDHGRIVVRTDQLQVFVVADTASVRGKPLPQLTAIWFYPAVEPDQPPRFRGVRTICDPRGFAILWEVLSSEASHRCFYPARSLEAAAERAWHRPLPGRAFCLEPPLSTRPEVLVARTVADGPQPMGPIVYLDHPALSVVTLRCRCESAQAETFPQSTQYRLVPLRRLDQLRPPGAAGAWSPPALVDDLDTALRWPDLEPEASPDSTGAWNG